MNLPPGSSPMPCYLPLAASATMKRGFHGCKSAEQSETRWTMNEDLERKDLARRLLSMIEHALASGLSLPLYLVLVSVNGQVAALRYDRGHPSPGSGERTRGWNGGDLHS